MNFTRKKRIKGRSAQTYKEWHSNCGQYRITWRSQVWGIEVTPRYFACVRCVRSPLDPAEYWGFAARRGTYKSFKAVVKACVENEKLWQQFLAMEGRDKVAQVNNLKAQAMVGSGNGAYCAMNELPVWAILQMTPRHLDLLPGGNSWPPPVVLGDPTRILKPFDEASPSSPTPGINDIPTNGPASSAEDGDGITTPETKLIPSKEADTDDTVNVQTASAPEKVRGKRSSKHTGRKSVSTKSKGTSTPNSKGRRKKRSRSSPKKRS